jgi:hypothetical protein
MIAGLIGFKVYAGKLLGFDAQIAAMTSKTAAKLLRAQDVYQKRAQLARSTGLNFACIYMTLLMWQVGAVLCLLDTYSAAPLIVAVTWASIVPGMTASAALTKTDVREAVLDLLLCRWASRIRRKGSVALYVAEQEQEGELAELHKKSRMDETCEGTEGSSGQERERQPDEAQMNSGAQSASGRVADSWGTVP